MDVTSASVADVAARLKAALEAGSVSSAGGLLDEDVTWGDCAGRTSVQRFIEAATGAGARFDDVSIETLDDRLVVSFDFGSGARTRRVHQAVFVESGRITEICDAGDAEQARSLRPVGPLEATAARAAAVNGMAPVLAVCDLTAAVAHYRALGFVVDVYEGDAAYAFAERDRMSLHLAEVADLDPAANTCVLYLYVSDADALYAQWRLARPAGRLIAPVDTEYGLREGAHIDPDGNLLRFGSALASPG